MFGGGGFEYGATGGGGYGGSGGMFGANDGGGFMADSGGGGATFGSPQDGGSQGRSKGNIRERQTLLPLTLAQLSHAVQDQEGDGWLLNDNEVHQVCVLGAVVERREQSTSITYVIEDGTGQMAVKHWFDEGDPASAHARRQECKEGCYVRCVGKINDFNNQKSLVAYFVEVVRDPNQIVHHLLQCVHTHCLQKAPKNAVPQPGFGSPGAQGGGGGFGGGQPLQSNAFEDANASLSREQSVVLNAFNNDGGAPVGRSVADVLRECQSQGLTEAQVFQSVDHFAQEGMIYSTVDESHYKSVNAGGN